MDVMANPHPTKSKPCKIGRKHTGEPSTRDKAKRNAGKKTENRKKLAKEARWTRDVAAYWRGEIDSFPEKPSY